MKIYYNDGGVLDCTELRISSPDLLIADIIYYVRTDEIYAISDDDVDMSEERHEDAENFEDEDDFGSEIDEPEYGPSNPWDAPGMRPSDFIRGAH